MNASVYIFGEFNNGYTQYPDDYTSTIFHNISVNAKSTTQIAIHRDGNLVYYGYIRKLQQDRYLGLCVVLNGLILKRIDGLFSLFENTISNLAANGQLIHLNEQGYLDTSVGKLYFNREEIDILTESLRAGFNRFENNSAPLPAVNYGTSKETCKDFVVDDDQNEIIKSSYTNGYTFIYKSKDFNTTQLNSYQSVLRESYKEKQELAAKLNALEVEHAKTLKQKKQFKFVIILFAVLFFLFVVLLGCAVGLVNLSDNLSDAKGTISTQHETISDLLDEKYGLEHNLQIEKDKRIEAEGELNNLQNIIGDRQPFIVKSTSFSFSSGYLTIDYYGMVEDNVSIQVIAFDGNGDSYTNTANLYIHKGDNKEKVFLSSRLDSDMWYSFEIIKDNVILGGDRH